MSCSRSNKCRSSVRTCVTRLSCGWSQSHLMQGCTVFEVGEGSDYIRPAGGTTSNGLENTVPQSMLSLLLFVYLSGSYCDFVWKFIKSFCAASLGHTASALKSSDTADPYLRTVLIDYALLTCTSPHSFCFGPMSLNHHPFIPTSWLVCYTTMGLQSQYERRIKVALLLALSRKSQSNIFLVPVATIKMKRQAVKIQASYDLISPGKRLIRTKTGTPDC